MILKKLHAKKTLKIIGEHFSRDLIKCVNTGKVHMM